MTTSIIALSGLNSRPWLSQEGVTVQESYSGHCQICKNDTEFRLKKPGFYRSAVCASCGSAPSQRALWFALERAFPNWRQLAIHESSPGSDLINQRLCKECSSYSASQYRPELELGKIVSSTYLPCGVYSVQNLEDQAYSDETFDLVITQDVFEHVFDPLKAIVEIARTLKKGGAALMGVPVVRGFAPSRRRARLKDGQVEHLLPPEYHGNPVSNEGSLVTVDWGYDIASHLSSASNLNFIMQTFENSDLGIKDECNQILIGYKTHLSSLE